MNRKYRIKFRSLYGAVTEATSDDYDKIKSVWDRALLIPGNDDLLGGVEFSVDDGATWALIYYGSSSDLEPNS
jgi:hypothetical protein